MSLGHCLKEGGRDGIRDGNGVKPGSQYNAGSCIVLRSFAIMCGIVNVLRSMQVAHANKFNTSVPH